LITSKLGYDCFLPCPLLFIILFLFHPIITRYIGCIADRVVK